MIGARGRGKGGNFIEAGATRCRECVYLSPDAQGLSHLLQVTSEALPYWCILPLIHKVSHTLAIGLYLPRLDGCILPLMHKVSHTADSRAGRDLARAGASFP